MKNRRLFIICLFGILICDLHAQLPDILWGKSWQPTQSTQFGTTQPFAVDELGNLYVTGIFNGTTDFDPGEGVYNLTAVVTNTLYVLKLDNNGEFLWAHAFGKGQPAGIEIDSENNIVVAGSCEATIDFDPGPGMEIVEVSSGAYVQFILKLNSQGEFIWVKSIGDNVYKTRALCIDANDNICLAGIFFLTSDFDPGEGTFLMFGNDEDSLIGSDVFILKLNSSGEFVFAKQFTVDFVISPYLIKTDSESNILICGSMDGQVNLNPETEEYSYFIYDASAFVVKMDSEGEIQWVNIWDEPQASDGQASMTIYDMKLDALDNIMLHGEYSDTVDIDLGPDSLILESQGAGDGNMFLLTLDPMGNFMDVIDWSTSPDFGADTNYNDFQVNTFCKDPQGTYYIAGVVRGTVDVDPDTTQVIWNPGFLEKAFLMKLNSAGDLEWAAMFGDPAFTGGNLELETGSNGAIFLYGQYSDDMDIDPGAEDVTFNTNSVGTFIIKLEGSWTAYGCTDNLACNFDPLASVDDASCLYGENGDFDCNGTVNIGDFLSFSGYFGCLTDCDPFDLNGDGIVNIIDLLIFLSMTE